MADQDLYLAGGDEARGPVPQRERRPAARSRSTPIAGPATDLSAVVGAYPLDVDGDGLRDLAVLRLGENVLLRGLGDCRFERANERVGVRRRRRLDAPPSARPGRARRRLPTLAFGNYLN